MKYLKKFEIRDYFITTDTDLRYAILLLFKGDTYVRCAFNGVNQQFVEFDEVKNISQVVKYLPQDVDEAITILNFDNIIFGISDFKFDVMTIEELELLINTNKYNL